MVKVKRMMETDESGVKRQFMPITHVSAVLGLEKMISGQSKVLSVNGKYGAVILTKADLGLENAITELPYASETSDGILTAEMFQKIVNGEGGTYILPIATPEQLGGIKVGELLEVTEEGVLSATNCCCLTRIAFISLHCCWFAFYSIPMSLWINLYIALFYFYDICHFLYLPDFFKSKIWNSFVCVIFCLIYSFLEFLIYI